jgi:phage shock protein A
MRAKLSEARRKLTSLSARQQAAVARKQFHATLPGTTSNGLARFEQMQARVEFAEAEATAFADLCEHRNDNLEASLTAREDAQSIEAELATLKQKVRSERERAGG